MSHSKISISGIYLIKALLIIGSTLTILYIGSSLLMPLVVAAIIAILLDKPTQKLKQWGLPSWLSITLSIIILLIIFMLLTWLVGSQINSMAGDWPTIKEKANEKLNDFSEWANKNLQWDYKDYIEDNKRLIDKLQSLASDFLSSIMSLLSQSLIVFVYIILLLAQKNMFIKFFKKLTPNPSAMVSLLSDSSKIIRDYLFGKSKVMLFLFGIYYIGFSFTDVPYAFFLAAFAALFSIIPYVGNIIGGGIAVLLTFLYSGGISALIVIGVISAAQLVESYVFTPLILGDQINLNPFITIFGIILFSTIWGIVGAIIALPVIGVLKVIFEYTNGMEAYAYLIEKKE